MSDLNFACLQADDLNVSSIYSVEAEPEDSFGRNSVSTQPWTCKPIRVSICMFLCILLYIDERLTEACTSDRIRL